MCVQEVKQREGSVRARALRARISELQASADIADKDARVIAEEELAAGKLVVRVVAAATAAVAAAAVTAVVSLTVHCCCHSGVSVPIAPLELSMLLLLLVCFCPRPPPPPHTYCGCGGRSSKITRPSSPRD